MNTDKEKPNLSEIADKLSTRGDLFPEQTQRAKELLSGTVVLDKQPQTVYVITEFLRWEIEKELWLKDDVNELTTPVNKIENVYLITPEELQALKVEWQREAAEKALHYAVENIDSELDPAPLLDTDVYLSIDITEYLDKNHPLKLNK